ncbi:MAG: recombination mediator RecR, partial [Candidatus Methylomirabilota bacterium]
MLPKSIQNAIDEFSRLPGIGPKSAARIVFYLISKHEVDIEKLSNSIAHLKRDLKICSICFNYAESEPCEICQDAKKDDGSILVVEEPLDVLAIERAGFNGKYHVLGGVISPINGVGPDDLRIGQLIDRVRKNENKINEIILATNPTLEGEATAVYIAQRLQSYKIKVTRLARGLPSGGDLEYADEATLSRSIEG